ncbi:MAG: sugar transporter [Alphaproteobacteria bacterium]|jgi:GPH family glycoside/pentoside/hexuronide:cation symporter|nr:sugar transporter [Alphaproteobacteria bacterium]
MSFVKGRLPLDLRFFNGLGAVAFGVKDGGFLYFLLPFYNLVLGVDAWLVSLALATALVIDAFVDPLIGHLSDRTYTRWGRRLPWLYIAPIPLALMWTLLWSPPFAGTPSFWEIVALAVGVRLLLSACEVPSVSLVPEITDDYVARTTLFRFRFLFGWIGGLLMMLLTFAVFLPTEAARMQPEGYATYGIVGAIVIAASVIGSAAGQHRYIAQRPAQPPGRFSLSDAFGEIVDAFREHAFVIFALGGLATYVSHGVTLSITIYVTQYVWQFSETAFVVYPLVLGLSVVFMFLLAGPLHRRFGKQMSAAFGALAALGIMAIPYTLFLVGLWPQAGSTASTIGFMTFMVIANTAGVVSSISATSMVAEIVEAFEERTGKRAEATFYSGNWLIQKCATGGGIMLSGLIVSAIGLEPGTPQGEVSDAVAAWLAILYILVTAVLAVLAAFWLARFPITQEQHEARVAARHARLADAPRAGEADPLAARPRAASKAAKGAQSEHPQTG